MSSASQLKLVYSNSNKKMAYFEKHSTKLKMSRVGWDKLPSVCRKIAQLYWQQPAAAALLEKLVDDALRRKLG